MKSRGGFTLVELLVVIVILGILAAIGIQQFGAVQTNAANRAHLSNIRILKSGAQMYYMANSDDIAWDGDGKVTLGEAELGPYVEDFNDLKVPDRAGEEGATPGTDQWYTVTLTGGTAGDIAVEVGVTTDEPTP